MKISFNLEELNDGNYYLSEKEILKSGIGTIKNKKWTMEVSE